MPPFRLLALDMDGTLIDQDLQIRPAVKAAIQAAKAGGVHVTLATGRMVRTTRPFAAQLDLDSPLICYQGAYVEARDGRVLHSVPLNPSLASELIGLLLERKIYVQAYINDELWIAERRPELAEYQAFSTVELPVHIEPDLRSHVHTHAPTKLLWMCDPATLVPLLAQLDQHFGKRLSIFRSHDRFGEAANPQTSKGLALAKVADYYGIAQANVMAIGDRQNDVSMLEWAGLGLAMGNGDAYAKAAANHTIPSYEQDGVAYAINRWILETV